MSTPRIGSSIRMISASEPSARANSAFCWLPPDSDRMLLSMSGVRMPIRLLPVVGELGLALRRRSAARGAAARASGCRCSRRSTRAGRCRRPGGRRRPAPPAPSTSMPAGAARAASKIASSSSRLAVAGEAGEADDLARDGRRARRRRVCAPGGRAPAAALGRARRRRRARRASARACDAAHGRRPACRGRRRRRGRVGDHLAVAHHDDAVGSASRISPRRCEIRMQLPPPATKRRTKASSWPAAWASSDEVGSSRMTRSSGVVGHREGARHLDHLAPADRQVADDVAGADAVAGKDLVELVDDQRGRLARASRSRVSGGWLMRVFSATVRFGQSDSSWKTQRMPSCWARGTE